MAQPLSPIHSVSLGYHILIIVASFLYTLMKKYILVSKITLTIFVLCLIPILFVSGFGTFKHLFQTINGPIRVVTIEQQPEEVLPEVELMAWLPWWDEDRVVRSVGQAREQLSVVSPVWYRLDRNGALVEIDFAEKQAVLHIATESAVLVVPSVTNDTGQGFSAEVVSNLLKSADKQSTLLDTMVVIATTNGYAGWDFDWEEIALSDKDAYTGFLKQAAKAFKAKGLMLSVTVHAKEGNATDRAGTKGQDWKALGQIADMVRIMAYDYHTEHTAAGAITPSDRLISVVTYAKSVIPEEKIVVGLPLYGYDWNGVKGEGIEYTDAMIVIKENQGHVIRDETSYELIGTYTKAGVVHEVWFQDAESVHKKMSIVQGMGMYKFSFWRLGGEDETLWTAKVAK